MLRNKEDKEYIAYTIASVVKMIVMNKNWDFSKSAQAFLKSKTYALLVKAPRLYFHEGPDYFYDMWNNEQKYGKPIESVELELEGKI